MFNDNVWDGLRNAMNHLEGEPVVFRDNNTGRQYIIGDYDKLSNGMAELINKHANIRTEMVLQMLVEDIKEIVADEGQEVYERVMARLANPNTNTQNPVPERLEALDNDRELIPYPEPREPNVGLWSVLQANHDPEGSEGVL